MNALCEYHALHQHHVSRRDGFRHAGEDIVDLVCLLGARAARPPFVVVVGVPVIWPVGRNSSPGGLMPPEIAEA